MAKGKNVVRLQRQKQHSNKIDFSDFHLIRYGRNSPQYKQTCARLHASTGGRCTQCGVTTTRQGEESHWTVGELHHGQYFSKWLWLQDLWRALTLQKSLAPLGTFGAIVPGRERIGKTAWPVCRRCHDHIHKPSNRLWIDEPSLGGMWGLTLARYGWARGWVLGTYRNRNTWKLTQMMRARWWVLRRSKNELY